MPLFQTAVLTKYLAHQDNARMATAYAKFQAHFHDAGTQENIRASKEEQYQEGFLRDLFVNILGYTLNPSPGFELTTEFKNEKGSKKADGAILRNGKAIAVIELKGTDTTDLTTINTQAFNYKANHTECVYVITSNFEKLRFFIDNAVEHLEFDLFSIGFDDFKVLWLCLQRDNLLAGLPKKVKAESLSQEEKITKDLYKDYSAFKNALWQDLVKNHADLDPLLLYKKTQKLLDRFLFILFAEDKQLLEPNTLKTIIAQWRKLRDLDEYRPLYERCQKYFGYLNTGHKSDQLTVFAYNGGLFKADEVLDRVRISDDLLEKHLANLFEYDFNSEVDVNILGHIFEHSLNDIEAITAQLEGRAADAKKSKRKKDGVFYTPKYITQYIVENTIGRLCTEKKDELALIEEEYARGRKGRNKKIIEGLDTKLEVYRQWLLSLTICDPACGSGAFLNQALDFLIAEHRYVDELQAKLLGHSIRFIDIGDHILERNIYGVDINEESVEIAKLSLWLRTATRGRKLNDLSGNIKCGNSLISDPAVAGGKAFDWQKEFPQVFAKGGFDVVIGNPPYVTNALGKQTDGTEKVEIDYFIEKFKAYQYKGNLYNLFVEKGCGIAAPSGFISYIIPNTFLFNSTFSNLRNYLLETCSILSISNLLYEPFDDATIGGCAIPVLQPLRISKLRTKVEELSCAEDFQTLRLKHNAVDFLEERETLQGKLLTNTTLIEIIRKASEGSKKLGNIVRFYQGIITGDNKKYISKEKLTSKHVPILRGADIQRYYKAKPSEYVYFDKEQLWSNTDNTVFETIPKLINRQTSSSLVVCIDYEGTYALDSTHSQTLKDEIISMEALLAIENSKLMNAIYSFYTFEVGRAFAQVKTVNLKSLPIKIPTVAMQTTLGEKVKTIISDSSAQGHLIQSLLQLIQSKYALPKLSRDLENWPSLDFKAFLKELKKVKISLTLSEEAEWMSYFNEQKAKAQALQAQIDRTDKEIDRMVYALYGLCEEEVAVVEGRGVVKNR